MTSGRPTYPPYRLGRWCGAGAPVVAGVGPEEERIRIAVTPALVAVGFGAETFT